MNRIVKINPILVTGVERSGSTLVAHILDMCGVFSGNCNSMFENKAILQLHKYHTALFPETSLISIPVGWSDAVNKCLKDEGLKGQPWMVKGSKLAQYWPIWQYSYPDAKWLIVRRRTGDIIQSCVKTGYMKQFKNPAIREKIGVEDEEQGWLWWTYQYQKKFVELVHHGANVRVVWPERMVDGDFSQMKETIEWLNLKWNSKIPEVITPLLAKSRRGKQWQGQQ